MDRYGEYDDEVPRYREPKSSSKSTWVVLGIGAAVLGICLVVCAGLVYMAAQAFQKGMANFSTSMQQIAQQAQQMQQDLAIVDSIADGFMQDVAAGRLDGAYARTSKEFQARQTLPQLRAFVSQNPALKNYQPNSIEDPNFTSPVSATVEGTVDGPNGEVAFTLVIVKEGQTWKVDRFTIP